METRELYKQKYEAQLHEWSAKIGALKAHSEKLSAEAKLDAKPHLDTLHDKVVAATDRLHEIATATDDRWSEVSKGAELVWTDIKASVEGAYDALKKPPKPKPS